MRPYLLVAAVIIGATTALVGCSTLQRAVEIQSDLDGLTRSGVVGSIATLDDGTTTAVMTSGVPNRTNGDSIGKNDRVRIGSVTKTFTASLVLQLVAEGKVDLDAPIERYLPGLLHSSDMDGSGIDGSAITVRQLLQHRSGLPEFAGEPGADEWIAANENRTLTPSAAVAIALGKPAQFVPPGTSFVYTNTNYIVLGMLVESVSGRSYADELRSRILDPLDLEDTYLPPAGELDIRGRSPDGLSGSRRWPDRRFPHGTVDPLVCRSDGLDGHRPEHLLACTTRRAGGAGRAACRDDHPLRSPPPKRGTRVRDGRRRHRTSLRRHLYRPQWRDLRVLHTVRRDAGPRVHCDADVDAEGPAGHRRDTLARTLPLTLLPVLITFSISVRDENDRVGAVQLRRFQRQVAGQDRLSRGDGRVKCCAKCGRQKQGTPTGRIGQRSLQSARITVGGLASVATNT